jgi:putative ABC transport system permease protein
MTGSLLLDHVVDSLWGVTVIGALASWRGGENELGNYRAPTATAYAYSSYMPGPFAPGAGLSLTGFAGHDRDALHGDAAHNGEQTSALFRAAGNLSLEWSTDWIGVERSMPLDRLYVAMVGHVEVPVRMLIGASVLLALIGGLGLASMMTVNVLERTRELGVMRAIGAKPLVILKVIVGEGVLTAAMSWFVALLLSLPLTRAIGLLAARMFGAPLPFTVSLAATTGWLGFVLAIAGIASAAPALRASRLVVRQALAYE